MVGCLRSINKNTFYRLIEILLRILYSIPFTKLIISNSWIGTKLLNKFGFRILRPFYVNKECSKTLFILRFDSIGDLVLSRDLFKHIIEDTKYQGYKFVLIGNKDWKELANNEFSTLFHEIVYIDRNKILHRDFKYIIELAEQLTGFSPTIIINPVYSNENYLTEHQFIFNVTNAKESVCYNGDQDLPKLQKERLEIVTSFYTNQIIADQKIKFEYERNLEFAQKLLAKTLPMALGSFSNLTIKQSSKFFTVFPGAGASRRQWSPQNFKIVILEVHKLTGLPCLLLGGLNDISLGQQISEGIEEKVSNRIGQIPLTDTVQLIEQSKFLISNETSAPHISAAVKTPFVCISNGNHFQRFNPYPAYLYSDHLYIYPSSMQVGKIPPKELADRFKLTSTLDINEIKAAEVLKKIVEFLEKFNFVKKSSVNYPKILLK